MPRTDPLRTFRHDNGTVTRVFPTWVETDLPFADARTVHAVSERSVRQATTAVRLGYGGDVDRMTRDHDLLHNLLADMLGLRSSFSMLVAAGIAGVRDARLADVEETAVLALQRLVREADLDLLRLP